MKLARKITLALGLLAFAVLAAEATLEAQREQELAFDDMAHDHQLLGHTLGAAIARAWQLEGGTEALALLEQANRGQREVRLRWVWLDAPAVGPAAPRVSRALLGTVRAGQPLSLRHQAREGPLLVSYIPVGVAGRPGALEVSEPLTALEARAHRTALVLGASTVAVAVLFLLAALWLGRWLVGHPVALLADMARKVGEGDFSARVQLDQKDELGALAGAMNRMSEGLAEARDALAAETERRLTAVEQLRHAERLTTVGKLAAGMAHELGTPLNVVQGQASMVASGEVEGEEARESARVVVEQVKHITRIIRQLLDFARRRTPRRAPEALDALLGHAVSMLQPLAARRGVRLEAAPTAGLEAEVDAGQLQQVLTNLVVNAVHATPAGGAVRLSARAVQATPPPDVEDGARQWVRVDVEDSGSGIPPDVLPRIFEPFFTTKDVGEGTGLGLSVTYGLVRDHGGWIDVHTEVGRGSRFSVFLPKGEGV